MLPPIEKLAGVFKLMFIMKILSVFTIIFFNKPFK
jgi:hypothetical protein